MYGTFGSIVRIDRVRKSSGGMDGKLMLEKDLAAERKARKEAVKFDLNADRSGLKGCKNEVEPSSESSAAGIFRSSRPRLSTTARGCSSAPSSDGD